MGLITFLKDMRYAIFYIVVERVYHIMLIAYWPHDLMLQKNGKNRHTQKIFRKTSKNSEYV